MKLSVAPFLMFEGKAEEAMNLYTTVIPGSSVLEVKRYGAEGPGPEGTIMTASISIAGTTVMFTDSPMEHGFTFTPSTSFFVTCTSEEELDEICAAMSEDGEFLMPPNNYGFSQKFTWLKDRFGVSWQLNWG